jgi:hypothetical protein
MQPLGPSENGCDAFLMSLSYLEDIQRSGMKASGLTKFAGLCDATQELTQIDVF